MGDDRLDNWVFVANDGIELDVDAVSAVANEALAAVPEGVLEASGELMPRVRPPDDASCRICGSSGDLSREHIPPRAAGNTGKHYAHSFSDWLERDSLDDLAGGSHEQGGSFGWVLCRTCNSRTGRFATEYGRWCGMAAKLFVEDLRPVEVMDAELITPLVRVGFSGCHPAQFARQVLSMMVSLAGSWPITALYPELKATLLDGTPCALPAGISLEMGLCAPVAARHAGPTLVVDLERPAWRWVAALAYPPFAFELTLARSSSEYEPSPLCGIGGFLEHVDATQADVELDLIVGFAHTPYPTDYRTRAQIKSGRDIYGRLPGAV